MLLKQELAYEHVSQPKLYLFSLTGTHLFTMTRVTGKPVAARDSTPNLQILTSAWQTVMRVSGLQGGGKYYCSVGHFPSYCEKMQDKQFKEGRACFRLTV